MSVGPEAPGEAHVAELVRPVLKAVMISMSETGRWKTTTGEDFFSHDDYDAAHASLNELARRAKLFDLATSALKWAEEVVPVNECKDGSCPVCKALEAVG